MPASAKLERSAWAHKGCAVCPHSAQVIALAAPALSVQLEQCEQGSELIPSWASPSSLNVTFFEACSYTVLMRKIRSGNCNRSLPFNFELRWPMSGNKRSHDGSWKSNHVLIIGMLKICLCLQSTFTVWHCNCLLSFQFTRTTSKVALRCNNVRFAPS